MNPDPYLYADDGNGNYVLKSELKRRRLPSWSTLPASEQERLGRVVYECFAHSDRGILLKDCIRIARAVWEAACK